MPPALPDHHRPATRPLPEPRQSSARPQRPFNPDSPDRPDEPYSPYSIRDASSLPRQPNPAHRASPPDQPTRIVLRRSCVNRDTPEDMQELPVQLPRHSPEPFGGATTNTAWELTSGRTVRGAMRRAIHPRQRGRARPSPHQGCGYRFCRVRPQGHRPDRPASHWRPLRSRCVARHHAARVVQCSFHLGREQASEEPLPWRWW